MKDVFVDFLNESGSLVEEVEGTVKLFQLEDSFYRVEMESRLYIAGLYYGDLVATVVRDHSDRDYCGQVTFVFSSLRGHIIGSSSISYTCHSREDAYNYFKEKRQHLFSYLGVLHTLSKQVSVNCQILVFPWGTDSREQCIETLVEVQTPSDITFLVKEAERQGQEKYNKPVRVEVTYIGEHGKSLIYKSEFKDYCNVTLENYHTVFCSVPETIKKKIISFLKKEKPLHIVGTSVFGGEEEGDAGMIDLFNDAYRGVLDV